MADPAFRGFVESTLDALLVFEGCKRGYLPKISRRLQDYEKRALVTSGAIFVFDEEETGIKRWTDGMSWSPSRTLGNFLVYRELDKKPNVNKDDDDEQANEKPPPGTSNAASRLMGGLTSKADPVDDSQDLAPVPSTSSTQPSGTTPRQRSLSEAAGVLQMDRARERALVGSLTSSHRFRSDGLVKKTISLSGLHLVAYYRLNDVTSGRLRTPSSHAELMSLEVSPCFLTPSLFRMPPIVEVGLDGQVRYKGESDTPLSPLTRSGSSQGYPTPNPSQSRPTTSDPYGSSGVSHFTPLLAARPPSRDYPAAPGSPRRGATATTRNNNRFDPYSVGRYSPNTSAYSSATGYPFANNATSQSQPSPNSTNFPSTGETQSTMPEADTTYAARPLTGTGETLNSVGTSQQAWYHQGQDQVQNSPYQNLPTSRGGFPGSDGSNGYYQPRHPVPYTPASEVGSSAPIFAYNPPSSAFSQRRSSQAPSPTMDYSLHSSQQFSIPARPSSQPFPSQVPPPSQSSSQLSFPPSHSTSAYHRYPPSGDPPGSPYDTPPPSSANQINEHYPFPPVEPSQSAVSRIPASIGNGNASANSSPSTWNSLERQSASDTAIRIIRQPSSQNRRLDHLSASQTPSTLPERQHQHNMYAASVAPAAGSNYLGQGIHQPSGLVVGYNIEDSQQPAIHGLGVVTLSSAPTLEGGVGIGSYQSREGYGNQDHSQLYRQQQSIPPQNLSSSLTTPNTAFTLAASPYPPHPQSQEDHLYRHARNHFGKIEEIGQLPGNGNAGWWSAEANDQTRAAWPEHNLIKKEYSHG